MLRKVISAAAATAFIGALLAVPAFAGGGSDGSDLGFGYRPGWGFGDENHDHTGSPGTGDNHPGYGKGDDNREHSGPPGQASGGPGLGTSSSGQSDDGGQPGNSGINQGNGKGSGKSGGKGQN